MSSADFGNVLHERRTQLGLSMRTVAQAADCDQSMVSKVESGKKRPTVELASRLDKATDAGGRLLQIWNDATPPGTAAPVRRPRQLPSVPPRMLGGESLMSSLDEAVAAGGPVVLTGPAGVGKTASALRWAHSRQRQYPDGAMVLSLRGRRSTPGAHASTHELLGALLADLLRDRRHATLPEATDARATLLRELTYRRRLLLLADDAADADQLRPLLDLPGVTVLITSRAALPSVGISHHATHVTVPPLPPATATTLLGLHLGRRGLQAPDALGQIAAGLDHLPLALLAAVQHILAQPHRTLDDLAADLTGPQCLHILHTAVGGDPRYSLPRALEASARTVSPQARNLLRQHTTSPLAGTDPAALGELAREHLLALDEHGYRLPELVRIWALNFDQN